MSVRIIKRQFPFKDQQGFVLLSVGITLLTFLGLIALVVGFGHIFVTKSQLQNTSDAAALAAAVEIPQGTASATQKALQFGGSHYVAGSKILIASNDVQFGNYNFPASTYQMGAQPFNFVSVAAKRVTGSPSGPLELFFARFFGQYFSNVSSRSHAVLDNHVVGVTGKNRLIPRRNTTWTQLLWSYNGEQVPA